MKQHTRDDLDSRVRRAWPIALDEIARPPSDVARMRAMIDERIAAGADPDAGDASPAGHRTATGDAIGRRRRYAVALAGVVLLAGVIGVGGLVAGRLRDPADRVDFADSTARVRSAIATTREALDTASVTHVRADWVGTEGEQVDARELVERTDPAVKTTTVTAANGDWSHELEQLAPGTGGAVDRATAGMRNVGGQWYERGPTSPTWEHVVAEDGEGPSDPPVALLDGRLIADLLERYDGTWTPSPDGPSGLTRYDAADAAEVGDLAKGIRSRRVPTELVPTEGASDAGNRSANSTNTVQMWIDDETGLIHRVFVEWYYGVNPSAGEPPFVSQDDVTIEYGAAAPVEVPEQVTDITLDEWCARNTGSCK